MYEQALRKQIASLFIVGIPSAHIEEHARYLIADLGVAGTILFKRNIINHQQTHQLIQSIKQLRQDFVLVCVDQEGGRVQRLKHPLHIIPPMQDLGNTHDLSLIEEIGFLLGHQIHTIGFDLTFSPVVDVNTNPLNPVIGDRSFGTDSTWVCQASVAFLSGLQRARILSCAKHFPGHGDTLSDSHLCLPRIPHNLNRLRQIEWPPFISIAQKGVDSIMSAHVIFETIDDQLPATLSRSCIDFIRQDIHFNGPVLSDDLEMKAITQYTHVPQAAVMAIQAGCDGILICHTKDLVTQSIQRIYEAVANKELQEERINEAYLRMQCLLKKGLANQQSSSLSQLNIPLSIQAQQFLHTSTLVYAKDPTEILL